MEDLPDARARRIILGAPLAGMIVGAAAGGLAASIGAAAAALERIGGPLLGKLLASSDNLALAGGLIGLALAARLTAARVRRNSPRDDG
jgi:hypothetical protein